MAAVPGRMTAVEGDEMSGDFFIPDLCAPRSVFFMILLVQLMAIVYVLAVSALPRFNWDLLAVSSLFVQWVVLLSAAVLCQLRRPLSRISLPAATAASLAVVLAVTALSSSLALQLYPNFARQAEGGWWLLRNVLVAAVLTGILLRYFFLRQQLRLQEKLELQSRLDSLRSRIRPHFLFNTLNSIASLIMSRPEAAEQAVEDLAELFRVSLQDNQRATTVADELRLCELYLGIEKLRMGERLQVDWQIDNAAREQPMISLILQPLIENAVYHGIAALPRGGTITVFLAREAGFLRLVVTNPVPAKPAPAQGHRMALTNICQRLQAVYGAAGQLEVDSRDGRFRVEMSYPLGETL